MQEIVLNSTEKLHGNPQGMCMIKNELYHLVLDSDPNSIKHIFGFRTH